MTDNETKRAWSKVRQTLRIKIELSRIYDYTRSRLSREDTLARLKNANYEDTYEDIFDSNDVRDKYLGFSIGRIVDKLDISVSNIMFFMESNDELCVEYLFARRVRKIKWKKEKAEIKKKPRLKVL